MRKLFFAIAALTFLCYQGLIAQTRPLKLKDIPYTLTWVNSPKHFDLSDTTLTIVPQFGTDMLDFAGGGFSVHNAPKLLFYPDSNFVITAKLQLIGNKKYDGASLVIYSDTAHWAKLLLEYHSEKLYIACSNVTNIFTDDNYNLRAENPEIYFRIGKSGSLFTFYYSLDGKIWNIIRAFAFNSTEKIQIGFSAQSPRGNECKAIFTNIVYKSKGFSSYYTGE